jgi:ubiquinone/menaquinone biosynthesis C-methylase UbiE
VPKDSRKFWSRYARLYDFEINRFSAKAYQQMYGFIAQTLRPDMDILEIATGTGLIALQIAMGVKSVVATDFSEGMVAAARRKPAPANVSFSVEDATALSFADDSFDAVIISNALHSMPDPALALANIKRVLKPGGLLIAPTFSHGHLQGNYNTLNAKVMRLVGFETYSQWTPDEYVNFIESNGFAVGKHQVLSAAFPLVYLEATLD